MQKIPKKGAKGFFPGPQLAQASLWLTGPPNSFMVKKLARLGELTAAGLSFSSLGELQLSQSDPSPINRHHRGVLRGPRVHKWRELRKKNKKEEETKSRRCQIAAMIIPYIVPCSVFFVRPFISFVFKIWI